MRYATSVLVAGSLALGGGFLAAPSASAATPAVGPATASVAAVPSWCPLGTHSGPGGGCRGGSVNDNERLNRSLAETGRMYADATECALKSVGKSVVKNRKKPSVPGIAGGTVSPAFKCGREKGY
ncbi:hypothetical protein [Actinomycetospora lemnae]|uniref:Secreted protein n=1 Tax=Actinomycetospora lemnae TaxID=3019891 RepID=A0ABT5SVR2_9PSEU|nr:hypothetical protein [Actinomycetospora sp. DW7H6]MDD7966560.1 hypothetical protein [Actinomycetospora sp. DW7H6]